MTQVDIALRDLGRIPAGDPEAVFTRPVGRLDEAVAMQLKSRSKRGRAAAGYSMLGRGQGGMFETEARQSDSHAIIIIRSITQYK